MEKTSNVPVYQRTESVGSVLSFDRESLRTFLENESLIDLNDRFPEDTSLDLFRSITEDELEHDYGVTDPNDRHRLMHAILRFRDEDSDDENEVNIPSILQTLLTNVNFVVEPQTKNQHYF